MDISLLIKQRLKDLGLGQKDLAQAAQVTESYVSLLLRRKKAPPASGRTDLYGKMGDFLGFPAGELARLADLQRDAQFRKRVGGPLKPLFKDSRELILRRCNPDRRAEIEDIFEKQPFGELERLVTQKLLDVTQGIARDELRNETWLHSMAELSHRSYEQMRVAILEFLDTDVFSISLEDCASFLDPMIEFWDIDLRTFALEIGLNRRLAPQSNRRFEFAERQLTESVVEPALEKFLRDTHLSEDITEEEIDFLRRLKFNGRRPSPLYYYRELQNLRDPLHFLPAEQSTRMIRRASAASTNSKNGPIRGETATDG
jgi:transcriptional regulator with XRE-family HTH domain